MDKNRNFTRALWTKSEMVMHVDDQRHGLLSTGLQWENIIYEPKLS